MVKKSFGKGIEAIFSESARERKKGKKEVVVDDNSNENEESKKVEVRATFYVESEVLFTMKAFAHLERVLIKELIHDVFSQYIDSKGKKMAEEARKKYSEYLSYKKSKK